jgi:hypothetical protein
VKAGLQACVEAGLMNAADVDAAAHLILGALNEAAFVLAKVGPDDPLATALDQRMEILVRSLVSK